MATEKNVKAEPEVLVPRISLDEFVADKGFESGLLAGFKAYVGKVTNRRPAEWEATLKEFDTRDGRDPKKETKK